MPGARIASITEMADSGVAEGGGITRRETIGEDGRLSKNRRRSGRDGSGGQ